MDLTGKIYIDQTGRLPITSRKGNKYIQHPGGDRLAQTLTTVCRRYRIVDQTRKHYITFKYFQKFKNLNFKYGLIPDKDFKTLTPHNRVCVDRIGTYTIISKFRHPNTKIIMKELQLLCMTFINPEMGWFEIAEFPIIDQSSARIS